MAATDAFCKPLAWDAVAHHHFDALLLPGGHARGMREYLESPQLQSVVADTFARGRPVAAICHDTLSSTPFRQFFEVPGRTS
jgi:putative intracellular protease/amidase